MAMWSPNANDLSSIVVGPKTRKLAKGKRKHRIMLKLLSRLSGDTLARYASFASRINGLRIKFSYRPDVDLYQSQESETHSFAHPRRLWTVFYGQAARGKKMAYEYLLDQISFSDGDRIIDVGANTGDLALALRVLNKKVHFESFEPSPGEFAALCENLKSCSAVASHNAHQLALWSESADDVRFYLKPGKGDSSVIPIGSATGEVFVPTRRLDEVLPDDGGRYRLMKLEAEGAEPEVLRGAENLIHRIDYISADVGFERGVESSSTLPEVVNFLLQRNFEIVGFEGGRLVLLFRNRSLPDLGQVVPTQTP